MIPDKFYASLQMDAWIKNGYVPKFLYKYKSLKAEYTLDLLSKSELFFSRPIDFNDPFDCQLQVETSTTDDTINKWVTDRHPDYTSRKRKEVINEFITMKKKIGSNFDGIVRKAIEDLKTSSGLYCLACNNDNILMWSHYANCHTGICLKFDITESAETFTTPLEVGYTDNYPKYNYFAEPLKLFETLVQTKATCWSYEHEVRIFKESSGLYSFNPCSLVEICFGCKTSKEDISKIKKIIDEKKYSHVRLKRAEVATTKFELLIKDF